MENKKVQNHIIHIENRGKMDITGVLRVVTFTEVLIIINTSMGVLNIKGKALKINKLNVDNGDMLIVGEIQSLIYTSSEVTNKESIIKKLFK